MKTEKTEPYGYTRHTTESGATVTAEVSGENKDRRVGHRVVVKDPAGRILLGFEHHNPLGAAHELAALIDNAYYSGQATPKGAE